MELVDTKPCPFCGEEIKAVAVRCKHCQADLSTTAIPQTTEPDFTRGAKDARRDDFEQRFLEFAYKTTVPINPAAVAYALKIPISEADERLEDLAARDILVREVDDQGAVYFTLPGRAQRSPAQPPLARRTPMGELAPIQPPSEGTAVTAMVLNLFIPGVGSLVGGRTSAGVIQLVMWIIFAPLSLIVVGIPFAMATWIWALVTGIQIMDQAKRATTSS